MDVMKYFLLDKVISLICGFGDINKGNKQYVKQTTHCPKLVTMVTDQDKVKLLILFYL